MDKNRPPPNDDERASKLFCELLEGVEGRRAAYLHERLVVAICRDRQPQVEWAFTDRLMADVLSIACDIIGREETPESAQRFMVLKASTQTIVKTINSRIPRLREAGMLKPHVLAVLDSLAIRLGPDEFTLNL